MMKYRDYSALTPTQLLELLRQLEVSIAGAGMRTSAADRGDAPSMLETALRRREERAAGAQRGAPHPHLLAAIVEASSDSITSRTLDGTLLTWNKGAERIFGFTAEEALGRNHSALFPEENLKELDEINRRLERGESIVDYETVRRRKDGTLIEVSLSISPMIEDGRVVRVCSLARDISARKATERALQDALERERDRASELAAVLDAVPAVVFIAHDPECERISGNRAAAEILRMPAGSNMSKSAGFPARPTHFRILHDGVEIPARDLPVQRAARDGVEIRGFEEEIVFDDGTITHLIGNAKPLLNRAGKVYGAVSAFVDISAHKDAEDRIRELAHHDSLTGLPNRSLLMDRLEQALAISQRNQTRTGVIFVDLDRFKEINDRLGHHVGDQLLKVVAARLRESVREVDTVSRLGGDEFVVVLPELRQSADAEAIARKLLAAVSVECVIDGHRLCVTPSIGISLFPDHGRNAEALIQAADSAMYAAKQGGRNTCVTFRPDIGARP